jgi:hypothetical protein
MAKPIKRRRRISGRRWNECSRSSLRSCREFAQKLANRWGEPYYVIRFRTGNVESYSVQPAQFVHRLVPSPGNYIALTIEPEPQP